MTAFGSWKVFNHFDRKIVTEKQQNNCQKRFANSPEAAWQQLTTETFDKMSWMAHHSPKFAKRCSQGGSNR